MSCHNYTDAHTKGKTMNERREFGAKLGKRTVCEALINLLTLLVSIKDVLSALKKLGLSVEILWLT